MKNLIMILITFLSIQSFAQDHRSDLPEQRKLKYKNMTSEDLAQIQSQKMTQNLELTETQQKEVYAVLLDRNKTREAKIKAYRNNKKKSKREDISKTERLKMKNERMTQQAEFNDEMKTILSPEQMTQWQENQAQRAQLRKKKQGYSTGKK